MSIKNITNLRDFVAEQLKKLCEGNIEPEKANACAMLSANMLLSFKLEMDYFRLKNETPHIEFAENKKPILIEHKRNKK
jgi:hypothetical protein